MTAPLSHRSRDTHNTPGEGGPSAIGHAPPYTQNPSADGLSEALLNLYAESVDDLERTRIAMENRARSMAQEGLTEIPAYLQLLALVDGLKAVEDQAVKNLEKTMKAHPLGPWMKQAKGVGFKQGARLLASVRDPASRDTVSKLWAYCGYHVVEGAAPKSRRGQQANWSHKARMRAFLVAESCIKSLDRACKTVAGDGTVIIAHVEGCSCSEYRKVYDAGKAKYAGADITAQHKHNRALRLVAKAVLRDMWIAARKIAAEGQVENDTLAEGALSASLSAEGQFTSDTQDSHAPADISGEPDNPTKTTYDLGSPLSAPAQRPPTPMMTTPGHLAKEAS